MVVLITGGAGYIGSHVASSLALASKDSYSFDNLYRGLESNCVNTLIKGDIRNKEDIIKAFETIEKAGEKVTEVIHMAALTSVPESMENKELYEEVNLVGTENLIAVMKQFNCNKLIFSSTASVYRQSNDAIRETDPIELLNNYALTKYLAEDVIRKTDWLNSVIFRYFNVVGYRKDYDKSNETKKTNLVPALLKATTGNSTFKVFGNNHPMTKQYPKGYKGFRDYTCIRDYIDVRDIARAHVNAINYLNYNKGYSIFNLGTTSGSSVLDVIKAFEDANNVKVNYVIEGPRKGDPASSVADNRKARELLDWVPMIPLKESLKVL